MKLAKFIKENSIDVNSLPNSIKKKISTYNETLAEYKEIADAYEEEEDDEDEVGPAKKRQFWNRARAVATVERTCTSQFNNFKDAPPPTLGRLLSNVSLSSRDSSFVSDLFINKSGLFNFVILSDSLSLQTLIFS